MYRCAAVFVFSHAPRLNLEFSELMTPEEMSRLGFSEKAKEALSKVSDASFVGSHNAAVVTHVFVDWLLQAKNETESDNEKYKRPFVAGLHR